MLELNKLTIEIDSKIIIQNLNLIASPGDKIAIIGEEGNGKSTLLKVIAGVCNDATTTGVIKKQGIKIGYLKQFLTEEDEKKTLMEYLFPENNFYLKQKVLFQYQKQLDFKEECFQQPSIQTLSGGEKVKLQLLKLMVEEPDLYLFDEPTNDLDLKTLIWLENFIQIQKKPILYVSHDETLLKHTANKILHLELIKKKQQTRHTLCTCCYQEYVDTRLQKLVKTTQIAKTEKKQRKEQQEKLAQIRNKVEYRQETLTPSNPHKGKMLKRKMKSIKAQERRMEQQEVTELPDIEESISFHFEPVFIPPTKKIIELSIPILKRESTLLSQNIILEIIGPKHIAIIGNNGCGKTTLLTQIYHHMKEQSNLIIGYMPQHYESILGSFQTPMDFLKEQTDKKRETIARNYLGSLNFTKEEMTGDITTLSGGSKAKLMLLKLLLEGCDILLLDEPTRNLSPLSNSIIRTALKEYQGVIISISHDRNYIEEVCDTVYELTNTGLKEKKGEFGEKYL